MGEHAYLVVAATRATPEQPHRAPVRGRGGDRGRIQVPTDMTTRRYEV